MKNGIFILALALALPAFGTGTAEKKAEAPTAETKEAYVEIVENKLESWDRTLEQIKAGTYKDQTLYKDMSAEEAKRFAAALEEERKKVRGELTQLKDAKGDAWRRHQKTIEARFDDMRSRFGKRLAE